MNAFLSHGRELEQRLPPAARRAMRKASPLEKKMAERQRLSRSYRAWRRAETKAALEMEPRLTGFLKYLRTVTLEMGDELIDAIACCDWLLRAPQPVRLLALRMVNARCEHLRRSIGEQPIDDPLPWETSVYFRARDLLHAGGRA